MIGGGVGAALGRPANLPLRRDARRRKLPIRRSPNSAATDSGWNWTPNCGRSPWLTAIGIPSSVVAVTRRQSGMDARSMQSEWYRTAWNTLGIPSNSALPSCVTLEILPCMGSGARTTRAP